MASSTHTTNCSRRDICLCYSSSTCELPNTSIFSNKEYPSQEIPLRYFPTKSRQGRNVDMSHPTCTPMIRSWASVVAGTLNSSKPLPGGTLVPLNIRRPASISEDSPFEPSTPTASSSTNDSSADSTETCPIGDVVGISHWPFETGAVVICIDVECHCRNQTFAEYSQGIKRKERRVCEIGMAAYDTRKVPVEEVGKLAKATWPHIKSENLAIIENKHVVGSKHISWCKVGDANNFSFGKTRWIRKAAIKREFVKQIKQFIGEKPASNSSTPTFGPYWNERKIIWLTFGGSNDRIWLGEIDVDLFEEFPNSQYFDLQRSRASRTFARALMKPVCSAADLFASLGLNVTGHHNGGNDATWELRAFLASENLSEGYCPTYPGSSA